MSKFTSAVILAAGTGSRFGGDTKKQYIPLCGVPCIVRAAAAFEACPEIDEIILVGDLSELSAVFPRDRFKKIKKTVPGGKTRQESALLGFDAISDKADYVAVHDGARCLVTPQIITETVKAAYKYRAAAAAHRAEDTVKICDRDGMVEKTQDRDGVWLVQTPQVFLCDLYRVGAYMAKKDKVSVTDDCMLCERLGFRVKMVESGRSNIKLTSPDDLPLCEAILSSEKREGGI